MASLEPEINSIDGILRVCRAGLERSKSAGKNRVLDADTPESSAERRLYDCAIRIARQSIVNLHTGATVGHELLARPDASFTGPLDYFRLAAEASMPRQCDLLCLQASAAFARRFLRDRLVNVNVFPVYLS